MRKFEHIDTKATLYTCIFMSILSLLSFWYYAGQIFLMFVLAPLGGVFNGFIIRKHNKVKTLLIQSLIAFTFYLLGLTIFYYLV